MGNDNCMVRSYQYKWQASFIQGPRSAVSSLAVWKSWEDSFHLFHTASNDGWGWGLRMGLVGINTLMLGVII